MDSLRQTFYRKLDKKLNARADLSFPAHLSIKWIPLMPYNKSDYRMGIAEDGNWVAEGASGLLQLTNPKSFITIMALLEQPKQILVDHLKDLQLSDDPNDIEHFFPFVEIVRAGLIHQSNYWAELALNWFADLVDEQQVLLKPNLIEVSQATWASQKIRQYASKLLSKLK